MKKYNYMLLIIAILIFSNKLFSQANQEWVSRYNSSGSRYDIAKAIAVDGSGNVYVTGYTTTDANAFDNDFVTIKYNASGVQQWIQTYNGPGDSTDISYAIAVDNSGNVYITGMSFIDIYNFGFDIVTIKYNSTGTQQWLKRYTTIFDDIPNSMVIDGSGFIYIYGGTFPHAVTLKYNASGTLLWAAVSPNCENPSGWYGLSIPIKVDTYGNVYITGADLIEDDDYVVIKYNSSGMEQWISYYDGPQTYDEDKPISLDIDISGNVYVTGRSEGISNDDYATVKFNSSGVQQWVARYDGGNSDWPTSISVDANSNVIVTGNNPSKYTTIKYNTYGVQQWISIYDSASSVSYHALSMAIDALGNVYVTGASTSNFYDYVTVKYNSSGVQQWYKRYNGPDNNYDVAHTVKVDLLKNVYITGQSWGNVTHWDFATVKYSQQIGIKNISSEIPSEFSLSQNYPNPFNPITNISFDIPKASDVKLIIYNILGKEISTLVNEKLNAGTYKVDWDGSNYPSGIYFYKMLTNKYIETRKMLLTK